MTINPDVRKSIYRTGATTEQAPDEITLPKGRIDEVAEEFKKVRARKKVKLSCYIRPDLEEALVQITEKSHQSLSSIVERALLKFLDMV